MKQKRVPSGCGTRSFARVDVAREHPVSRRNRGGGAISILVGNIASQLCGRCDVPAIGFHDGIGVHKGLHTLIRELVFENDKAGILGAYRGRRSNDRQMIQISTVTCEPLCHAGINLGQ
jgi:hypothetical protein